MILQDIKEIVRQFYQSTFFLQLIKDYHCGYIPNVEFSMDIRDGEICIRVS